MHLRFLMPFIAVLTLAACGEDQTAQAPTTPTAPSATETAQAPADAPAAETGTTTTAAAPATEAPAAGGSAPSTTVAEPSGSTPTETTSSVNPAATPASSLEPFQGRTFTAGPVSLQLNPDNTFVMNEVDGNRRVEGRYAFQDGILTFSDPQGDIGPAQFPMRCRFEASGASEFRLADNEGACTRFKDLTFKPSAG